MHVHKWNLDEEAVLKENGEVAEADPLTWEGWLRAILWSVAAIIAVVAALVYFIHT